MVPLVTPLALCDTDANKNHITCPKSNPAPNFSCLNLRNTVVPLMMLLGSYDTHASANGHQITKMSCCTSDCLDLRNAMVPPTTMLALHDVRACINVIA